MIEKRIKRNLYMKEWMRIKRRNIKRICPDCEVNELDKGYTYCSECAEARRYIREAVKRHHWIKNNPVRYKEHYTRWNKKRDRRKTA